jgi:hypothetical protein
MYIILSKSLNNLVKSLIKYLSMQKEHYIIKLFNN